MAPAHYNQPVRDEEEYYGIKGDRKTRKPLVEKKRRARINESLQELRVLVAHNDLQSKMENAEVLEMTVKRVESILQNQAQELETTSREASQRFFAGYVQCVGEVHTFVSSCPGVDTSVAAELLDHLLDCMSLDEEGQLQVTMLSDVATDVYSSQDNSRTWLPSGCAAPPVSPRRRRSVSEGRSPPALSPAPSSTCSSSDDLCSSDTDETDSEQSHTSVDGTEYQHVPITVYSKSMMWRPW